MEETVYRQFHDLEQNHFWFIGRRRIFFHLLERYVIQGRTDLDILEIGCGAGGFLELLGKYGKVIGLDIAHDWLKICKDRGCDHLVTGSGYALPNRDNSLDLICLFDTIEHIPEEEKVLAECIRVLRPGGHIFISVPAYQWLYSQNDRVAHHQRRYTRGALRRKLITAGIEPLRMTYFNAFLFPLIVPAILVKKFKECMFPSMADETTNLTHQFAAPANWAFTHLFSAERHLLSQIEFPFGHSLIGIGRKP